MASRICIVGTSGAGKSHLARRLAARSGLPQIELDALYHQLAWTAGPPEEFRAEVKAALTAAEATHGGWITDGNFRSKLGGVLDQADLTVCREQFEPMVAAAPDRWVRLHTPRQARAWLARLDVGPRTPEVE